MLYFFSVIVGLVIGSFINAYVWRLKNGRSVWKGRSICPFCMKTLGFSELVPVLSFVGLKRRCRGCAGKISWQYPLVELSVAALFALVTYFHFGADGGSAAHWTIVHNFTDKAVLFWIRDLILAASLTAIFVYDLKYYLIPDQFSLPALIVVGLLNFWAGVSLKNILIGLAVGGLFFALQFLISKGAWIGGGDVRLGALMGAALGWPLILVGLFISYTLGGVVAVFLLAGRQKKWSSQIPFGPFLAVGTMLTVFWGQIILDKYLSILR
ncbi:prepilin peptidase [Candidatus Uhrbacteria bacterium]|nr:prepilin peptidase [Candidatus Uhrbacteria bacterium]